MRTERWYQWNTERWHLVWEGRTFIVYGKRFSARQKMARFLGVRLDKLPRLTESGYYDRKRNIIVDAMDGPMSIEYGPKGYV